MVTRPIPTIPCCCCCLRSAAELTEYIDAARYETASRGGESTDPPITPQAWVELEEGTWNPTLKLFCCSDCYVHLGMPSRPYHLPFDPKRAKRPGFAGEDGWWPTMLRARACWEEPDEQDPRWVELT